MNNKQKLDILEALACLKAMCATYETCINCPAYKGVCGIKYTDPQDYDLNGTDDTWRALK